MKRKCITTIVLLAILMTTISIPSATVEAKARKPSVEEFYIDDYGTSLSVFIENRTRTTIVISQKAKVSIPTYKYNGPGNPNDTHEFD